MPVRIDHLKKLIDAISEKMHPNTLVNVSTDYNGVMIVETVKKHQLYGTKVTYPQKEDNAISIYGEYDLLPEEENANFEVLKSWE